MEETAGLIKATVNSAKTTITNNKLRMKDTMNRKSILLAAALGLSLVNLASALTTNYVYVTGSTAARGQVYATLTDASIVFVVRIDDVTACVVPDKVVAEPDIDRVGLHK